MENDILALRQELDEIEDYYERKTQVTKLQTGIAAERALVQDLEARLKAIRALLSPPVPDNEEPSSSTRHMDDEDDVRLKVRGPKRPLNPARPFHCPQCSGDFTERKYLVRHQNQTGHGGRPYECPKCGEGFAIERDLQRHQVKEEHMDDVQ